MLTKLTFNGYNYAFSIDIISHYTIILGVESGEGKSWLYDTIRRDYSDGLLEIDCDYPVVFADEYSLQDVLNRTERSVVFVDEIACGKSNDLCKLIDNTRHLILAITRDSFFTAAAPLQSIYQVYTINDSFQVRRFNYDNKLPMCSDLTDTDIIVTEASENKSENSFLTALCKKYCKDVKIIAASGKDKIEKILLYLTRTALERK